MVKKKKIYIQNKNKKIRCYTLKYIKKNKFGGV